MGVGRERAHSRVSENERKSTRIQRESEREKERDKVRKRKTE